MSITRRFAAFLLLVVSAAKHASVERTVDRVIINKAKRELFLMHADKVVKSYRVALGRNPVGPKTQQGDGKTPEGIYSISGRNAASAFHRALRVSYPNSADRSQARRLGVAPGGDIMIRSPEWSGEHWQGASADRLDGGLRRSH